MNLTYGPKQRTIVLEKLGTGTDVNMDGSCCTFIKINDKVGAKLYYKRGKRDRCHAAQRYAARYRLAPLVGGKFVVVDRHGYQRFGYLTQIVDLPYSRLYQKYRRCQDLAHRKRLRTEFDSAHTNAKKYLKKALEAIGLKDGDLHEENIGTYKGRIVAIDFDLTRVCEPTKKKFRAKPPVLITVDSTET